MTSAATALPDAPQGLRVETIADPASFIGMGTTWNLLVHEAGIHHPFARHEWVRTWWECFGRGRRLRVLLVKDGRDPIALAPLMLSEGSTCGIRVRQLEFLANVHTPQFDFIVSRWPEQAYRAIWAHLAEQGDWDVLQLRDLPEGSATLDHLPRLAGADGYLVGSRPQSASPAVPLVGGWDGYLRGLRPKHRSNLRNRFRRLSRMGAVVRELASPADTGALDDALRIEAEGGKGGAGTAILRRPETEQFYRRLAAEAADGGWFRLHFLRVGAGELRVPRRPGGMEDGMGSGDAPPSPARPHPEHPAGAAPAPDQVPSPPPAAAGVALRASPGPRPPWAAADGASIRWRPWSSSNTSTTRTASTA